MRAILLISLVYLVGCGLAQDVTEACAGDLDPLCDITLGHDRDTKDQDDIKELETEIDEVNEQLLDLHEALVNYLDSLEEDIVDLIEEQNEDAQEEITTILEQQDATQDHINTITSEIAELQGYENIVEFIDPCGDGSGFDEVLLRTSSGQLVAYFQQGGNRFLTLLEPGNYRTTDNQRCNFTITSDFEVVD